MEENTQHFWHISFIISRKLKMQLKQKNKLVQCMEEVLWLIERVRSGLWSVLVQLTFCPTRPLLGGRVMHWKVFSSTLASPHQKLRAGDSRQAQSIQINEVISENEKSVFYCMEKTKWTFWPAQYFEPFGPRVIDSTASTLKLHCFKKKNHRETAFSRELVQDLGKSLHLSASVSSCLKVKVVF